MKVGLKMQNITYTIDKLLRNHIYKIIVIHWISYEPFEQPGPDICTGVDHIIGFLNKKAFTIEHSLQDMMMCIHVSNDSVRKTNDEK